MLRFLLWLTRVIFRKVTGKGTTMKARASPTLPCTGTGGGGGGGGADFKSQRCFSNPDELVWDHVPQCVSSSDYSGLF